MFDYISSFFTDPKGMLIMLLLALPGRLIAISAHEFAHAYVADRCGDHTARYLGRLTLNPIKHIDPVGFTLMMLVGFGWAKPVPVNPRNYRGDYRKDDLKVSLAGVTVNFILFIIGSLVLYAIVGIALNIASRAAQESEYFISTIYGQKCLFIDEGDHYSYMALTDLIRYAPYISDWLIAPVFGNVAGYITQMLMYFIGTNLVLAIFNLIPMPPLDGYHVLTDTILHRVNLFANANVERIFAGVMLILLATGVLSDVLGTVQEFMFDRLGVVMQGLFHTMGLL